MSDEFTSVASPGIDSRWLTRVPDADQRRIADAFPELRVVWNEIVNKFQVVFKDDAIPKQAFNDGFLRGWIIIATFGPVLNVDVILQTMRARQHFQAHKLRELGYAGDSDADVIEAYLDDADNVIEAMVDEMYDEAVDDYMDGPLARARDETGIFMRAMRRRADQESKSRAHSHYKLVVPARGVGGGRYILEKP